MLGQLGADLGADQGRLGVGLRTWAYGRRPVKDDPSQIAFGHGSDGSTTDGCKELGVTRQTLYRHLGPDGSLREDGQKLLER